MIHLILSNMLATKNTMCHFRNNKDCIKRWQYDVLESRYFIDKTEKVINLLWTFIEVFNQILIKKKKTIINDALGILTRARILLFSMWWIYLNVILVHRLKAAGVTLLTCLWRLLNVFPRHITSFRNQENIIKYHAYGLCMPRSGVFNSRHWRSNNMPGITYIMC